MAGVDGLSVKFELARGVTFMHGGDVAVALGVLFLQIAKVDHDLLILLTFSVQLRHLVIRSRFLHDHVALCG